MEQTRRGEVYQHIRACLAHLVVFEDSEVISLGTGFACTADGFILTAAHVVSGGFPVRPGEVDQSNRSIVAFFVQQDLPPILYKPAICPFEIRCVGMKPLQLDIALLAPLQKITVRHLTASVHPPKLGEEMYFGGYSDEVEFPFLADRHVLPSTSGQDVLKQASATGIKERLAGPIIKRATVGNLVEGRAELGDKTVLRQTAFYLDNQIHAGASGGPIVSINGTAHGIITKRMITKAVDVEVPGRSPNELPQYLKINVPSGATLGLGLEPLLALQVGSRA